MPNSRNMVVKEKFSFYASGSITNHGDTKQMVISAFRNIKYKNLAVVTRGIAK